VAVPTQRDPEAKGAPRRAPDPPEVLARFHRERDLVDIIALQIKRQMGVPMSVPELRSFGDEGLLDAARTFDESRGVPFRRFANLRVRGAIIDGLRSWTDLPRGVYQQLRRVESADRVQEIYDEEDAANPAATPQAADDRLGAYLAGIATAIALGTMTALSPGMDEPETSDPNPEQRAAEAELRERLREVVAALPEAERTMIERHYFGGATLDEAAASMGLSKSWGSRLHARAVELVARRMRQM
jgi:RNA polymerase sigma factor for flagellar operon FliA